VAKCVGGLKKPNLFRQELRNEFCGSGSHGDEENKMARFQGIHKGGFNYGQAGHSLFFSFDVSLFPTQGSAQVYKYVDKDGEVHFTDTPTDPRYKSYVATQPEKKEALGIQPERPVENHKIPSQENKKLDDLKDLY
jgi:hypothetical protein